MGLSEEEKSLHDLLEQYRDTNDLNDRKQIDLLVRFIACMDLRMEFTHYLAQETD